MPTNAKPSTSVDPKYEFQAPQYVDFTENIPSDGDTDKWFGTSRSCSSSRADDEDVFYEADGQQGMEKQEEATVVFAPEPRQSGRLSGKQPFFVAKPIISHNSVQKATLLLTTEERNLMQIEKEIQELQKLKQKNLESMKKAKNGPRQGLVRSTKSLTVPKEFHFRGKAHPMTTRHNTPKLKKVKEPNNVKIAVSQDKEQRRHTA